MEKKVKYGYCAMTADILHIGHIRQIKRCSELCEKLIVGVMTDDCVFKYKGHKTIIPYHQRAEILSRIKGVFRIIPQNNFEFVKCTQLTALKGLYGDELIIFDCSNHKREMADKCFPYMPRISSTKIKERIYESFVYRKRKA